MDMLRQKHVAQPKGLAPEQHPQIPTCSRASVSDKLGSEFTFTQHTVLGPVTGGVSLPFFGIFGCQFPTPGVWVTVLHK